MSDRLIELLKHNEICINCKLFKTCDGCNVYKDLEEQAEYLLGNGVIVPPCKVGDVVYKDGIEFIIETAKLYDDKVYYTAKHEPDSDSQEPKLTYMLIFKSSSIGEDVFLTKDEGKE